MKSVNIEELHNYRDELGIDDEFETIVTYSSMELYTDHHDMQLGKGAPGLISHSLFAENILIPALDGIDTWLAKSQAWLQRMNKH